MELRFQWSCVDLIFRKTPQASKIDLFRHLFFYSFFLKIKSWSGCAGLNSNKTECNETFKILWDGKLKSLSGINYSVERFQIVSVNKKKITIFIKMFLKLMTFQLKDTNCLCGCFSLWNPYLMHSSIYRFEMIKAMGHFVWPRPRNDKITLTPMF